MTSRATKNRKPAITLSASDHEKLSRLAESIAERNPDLSEQLLSELDRARVVADGKLSASIVRMGSTLSYSTDSSEARTVTLVFPGEADISSGKISILTPIGAALIGLSQGQSIDWAMRDGRVGRLTVESVDGSGTDPDTRQAS